MEITSYDIADENGEPIINNIPDNLLDREDLGIDIDILRKCVSNLKEDECKLIEVKYGLYNNTPKSLKVAASEMGISIEEAAIIEQNALKNLKEMLSHLEI